MIAKFFVYLMCSVLVSARSFNGSSKFDAEGVLSGDGSSFNIENYRAKSGSKSGGVEVNELLSKYNKSGSGSSGSSFNIEDYLSNSRNKTSGFDLNELLSQSNKSGSGSSGSSFNIQDYLSNSENKSSGFDLNELLSQSNKSGSGSAFSIQDYLSSSGNKSSRFDLNELLSKYNKSDSGSRISEIEGELSLNSESPLGNDENNGTETSLINKENLSGVLESQTSGGSKVDWQALISNRPSKSRKKGSADAKDN